MVEQHSRDREPVRVFVDWIELVGEAADGRSAVELIDERKPDLVFLDTSSLSRLSERGLEGPPTLAVEIISPYSARIDRVRKLQLYAQFGVPYYWIVAPDARTVEAYTLVDKAYEPSGSVILSTPGSLPPFADLVLDPAAIWR